MSFYLEEVHFLVKASRYFYGIVPFYIPGFRFFSLIQVMHSEGKETPVKKWCILLSAYQQAQDAFYGINCVPLHLQNSYAETLIPNVTDDGILMSLYQKMGHYRGDGSYTKKESRSFLSVYEHTEDKVMEDTERKQLVVFGKERPHQKPVLYPLTLDLSTQQLHHTNTM